MLTPESATAWQADADQPQMAYRIPASFAPVLWTVRIIIFRIGQK
jgi:hypothetical protein